jgi:hypothetical protein
MSRRVDPVEAQMVAAALVGILASQRSRPDPKLVCHEALDIGLRVAIALKDEKRELVRRKIVRN